MTDTLYLLVSASSDWWRLGWSSDVVDDALSVLTVLGCAAAVYGSRNGRQARVSFLSRNSRSPVGTTFSSRITPDITSDGSDFGESAT